jgi:hypothetical protein
MRTTGLADYLRRFEHQGGVIVCEEHRFIYMKAPRTGGTSILRKVLEPAFPGIVHAKASPESFARWKRELTDKQLEDYFIFSFVRNPWDRFVSIATYFRVPVDRLAKDFKRYQRRTAIRSHSLPLCQYTHCEGIAFADFIGRFENLQADFERVCRRIGCRPGLLPHESRTTHEHYSQYYDTDTKEAVAQLYARDIDAFGYRFEECRPN